MQVLIQYQLYQELQDVLGKYTFTKLSLNLVTEEANIRITNKWEELTTPPPKKKTQQQQQTNKKTKRRIAQQFHHQRCT